MTVAHPDDWTIGDVIHAYDDGTIVLDDGITTHNAERARRWLEDEGVCFNCHQWKRLRSCDFCAHTPTVLRWPR